MYNLYVVATILSTSEVEFGYIPLGMALAVFGMHRRFKSQREENARNTP